MKVSDIRSTVLQYRRYILSLEYKADFSNKDIAEEIDDLDFRRDDLIVEMDMHGWKPQHLVTLDKLLHEFDKYKVKLEELQMADTGLKFL